MSLGRLLRRASSKASDLLTLNPGGSSSSSSILDGEIIYSKNNVCVHPPELLQGIGEHHPGDGDLQALPAHFFFFFFPLSWGVSMSWALKNEEVLVGYGAKQSYGGLRKAIPTGCSISCLFNRKIDDVPPFSSGLVWIYLFQYILLCCQKRNSCHLRAVTSVALSNTCMGQGNQVSSCHCHCWSGLITHW